MFSYLIISNIHYSLLQIKWLKFDPDSYFVVLSNLGLHVYDEDLTHIKFYYGFEDKCKFSNAFKTFNFIVY